MATSDYNEVLERVEQLPHDEQVRLLAELTTRVPALTDEEQLLVSPGAIIGKPGAGLLKHAGSIDPDQLRIMEQAIEEGCERTETTGN